MKAFHFKTGSVGATGMSPMEPKLKLFHFLLELDPLPQHARRQGGGVNRLLLGQLTMVQHLEPKAGKVEKTNDVPVVRQRLTDVIDLSAPVFTAWVRKEGDRIHWDGTGCEVDYLTRRRTPNGVELCLDVQALCVPDGPTVQLFSSMRGDMLWHDSETFGQWAAGFCAQRHRQG